MKDALLHKTGKIKGTHRQVNDIRERKLGTTVAGKLNQGSLPRSGCIPRLTGRAGISGALFGYLFGQVHASSAVNPVK